MKKNKEIEDELRNYKNVNDETIDILEENENLLKDVEILKNRTNLMQLDKKDLEIAANNEKAKREITETKSDEY